MSENHGEALLRCINREDSHRSLGEALDHQRAILRDLIARAEKAEAAAAALREKAREAYELLLGDVDHSAWHSGHCYEINRDGRGCVCGLSDALVIIREVWESRSALADEPGEKPNPARMCLACNFDMDEGGRSCPRCGSEDVEPPWRPGEEE